MLPKSKKYWSLRYFFKRHQLSYGHCVTRSLRTNCDGLSTATWNDTRKTNTSKFLKLIQILFLIGAKKKENRNNSKKGNTRSCSFIHVFPFQQCFQDQNVVDVGFHFPFWSVLQFYNILLNYYKALRKTSQATDLGESLIHLKLSDVIVSSKRGISVYCIIDNFWDTI